MEFLDKKPMDINKVDIENYMCCLLNDHKVSHSYANRDSFITERTVQRIFQNGCQKAKINRNMSVHCLRHSFAAHLLEGGTDIRYIQELLEYSSSKTTEIYIHVTRSSISKIKSPLDKIMDRVNVNGRQHE